MNLITVDSFNQLNGESPLYVNKNLKPENPKVSNSGGYTIPSTFNNSQTPKVLSGQITITTTAN
jgi:hypothetical protein